MTLFKPDGSQYTPTANREDIRLRELAIVDELAVLAREATASVEATLALEDAGWVNLSGVTGEVITAAERIANLKLSRLYALKDPLGKQSIRLWTDYTFGSGMVWNSDEEKAKKVLEGFWNSKANQAVLSARGQRKSSDKLLIDGEIFFALFLGKAGESKIRRIDPLEITEIITDPDDKEDVRYFRRQWTDAQNKTHADIYRSTTNIKGEPADKPIKDSSGTVVKHTDEALIYHLTYNTITQRGNPLLLPALVWMKYYTKFLSSRIGIMLAAAKWAWKTKVTGGQTAVDAIKAKTQDKEIDAGSHIVENLGSDTQPIRTDTGAMKAYQDGRMIKLQVAAAVGLGEQYFGDISIGNLATAKTVELPMMKMFQSYQKVWNDAYQDMDEVVLEFNGVSPDNWYVDRTFPPIAPQDAAQLSKSIQEIIGVFPGYVDSPDVQQQALVAIGINDPAEALEQMEELVKEVGGNVDKKLIMALREFREVVKGNGNKE